MILLKIPLNHDDKNYLALELKSLLYGVEKKPPMHLVNNQMSLLAENGQIESLECYYSNLSSTSQEDTKIFKKMNEIKNKPVKEARDYIALRAYYDWQIRRDIALTEETYEENWLYPKVMECKENAISQLKKLQNIDPLAKECLFELLFSENFDVENSLEISNFRNMLFFKANQQINADIKNKLLYAYSKNLITFAPKQELEKKKFIISGVIQYYQKGNSRLQEFL